MGLAAQGRDARDKRRIASIGFGAIGWRAGGTGCWEDGIGGEEILGEELVREEHGFLLGRFGAADVEGREENSAARGQMMGGVDVGAKLQKAVRGVGGDFLGCGKRLSSVKHFFSSNRKGTAYRRLGGRERALSKAFV